MFFFFLHLFLTCVVRCDKEWDSCLFVCIICYKQTTNKCRTFRRSWFPLNWWKQILAAEPADGETNNEFITEKWTTIMKHFLAALKTGRQKCRLESKPQSNSRWREPIHFVQKILTCKKQKVVMVPRGDFYVPTVFCAGHLTRWDEPSLLVLKLRHNGRVWVCAPCTLRQCDRKPSVLQQWQTTRHHYLRFDA